MKKRTNTAVWIEKENRWCVSVQKNGQRKRFYSGTPGRTGQREANAKADAWLDDNIHDGRKKISALYAEWLEDISLTCGTSYLDQCTRYGANYILPVIGELRIDELTEGDLQKCINLSFKKRCLRKDYKPRQTSTEPLSRKTLMTIRATETRFVKWCRHNKYTALNPEDLAIPKNARTGERSILQPAALQVLFSVSTRLYYKRRVFDEYIYAYRFAVTTGLRPGELVGLWYGDIKGNTVNLRRSINVFDEQTTGKNENAIRSFDMSAEAREAYTAQVQLLKSSGVRLNYNTPLFQLPDQDTLSKRWRKYQHDNGIDPPVSLSMRCATPLSVSRAACSPTASSRCWSATAKTWTPPGSTATSFRASARIWLSPPPPPSAKPSAPPPTAQPADSPVLVTLLVTLFLVRSNLHLFPRSTCCALLFVVSSFCALSFQRAK